MKIEMKVTKEVDLKTLVVEAGVRYWEDATVNGVEDTEGTLIPFRDGDTWMPLIGIETGEIYDWPEGVEADIHYKVCDDGVYKLIDSEGNIVVTKEGYVPDCLCPQGGGHGDYIIMKVNGDGKIANWRANISDLLEDEED